MGETTVILVVKIIRKGDNILLSQEQYTEKQSSIKDSFIESVWNEMVSK